jgi:cytochrome c-type biogenesis protein CcmF
MEYISNLYLPGGITMWCALLFALVAVWGYSLVLRGDESARPFARRAYRFYALSVVLGSLVLLILLWNRDFRIEYVSQYSGMDLPHHYQLAAFWAGQKGSFLIWLLWGSLIGLPLMKASGRQEAPVMLIYTLSTMGLAFILVRENPFVMLNQAPADGAGLNPLLQDNWMVIHPPIMFVGYALSAVPFAFATAALWRRDYDGWARRAFPWALAGFMVLGAAIMLGGYWAYETLGWGGYWGWDPVENASLIPFLFGTALIHGLHMERVKGRYRRANYVLASLVFLSVLYGTFLTRSGVLADFSVHSFVDLGISRWLILWMGFFAGLAALLLALRLREVPTRRNEDPFLSRGTFLVLATIVVLVSALAVTWGMSAPLITRLPLFEGTSQVGPEWYNTVHFPLAVLVALLLAAVPFLTWREAKLSEMGKKLIAPAAVSAALTGIAAGAGVVDPFHLLFVFLASMALVSNLIKTWARARVGGMRAAGGYLSHVGVGVILIGILASSAYDESTKVTLPQGETKRVGNMELTFKRFIPRQGRQKERMEVEVVRDGGRPFKVYPKLFINDRTRQVMANPDIKWSMMQDLYVSPIDYDPGRPAGGPRAFQLTKGETHTLGDVSIRFLGFEISDETRQAMSTGAPITVGAALEVTTPEGSERIHPVYSFTQAGPRAGQVMNPPVQVFGGGLLRVGGINAGDGAVRLETVGVGPETEGIPAKLSVDVSRKPLIVLVWSGLLVILVGGLFSTVARYREARTWEREAAHAAGR